MKAFAAMAASTLLMLGAVVSGSEIGFAKTAGADQLDFGKIPAGHPRLLVGSLDRIKSNYRDSYWGSRLGALVIYEASQLLEIAPEKREMVGRRMLEVSRRVLRRVNTLTVAWSITGERCYFERAKQEILAVCAFSDWNPGHFLDVAEMTLAVAIGYDWLYSEFTPSERDIIAAAIIEKGLKPALRKKYFWIDSSSNWNQVCHTGLTAGAIAVFERDPELAGQLVFTAVDKVPKTMQVVYPEGGAYPEGPMYWSYGTMFNVLLISLLDNTFGTSFGMAQWPGLARSGMFFRSCVLPSGVNYAYSDAVLKADLAGYPMLWLAANCDRKLFDSLQAFELSRICALRQRNFRGASRRLLPLAMVFADRLPEHPSSGFDPVYFSTDRAVTPLAIMRTNWSKTASALAMKGGTAISGHAHLDTGSFAVELNGVPVAVELGYDNYTRIEKLGLSLWQTKQNSDRWRIFRIGPASHNLLRFGSAAPRVDGRGAALGLERREGGEFAVSFDLKSPWKGLVTSYVRTGILYPDGAVMISDRARGVKPGTLCRWQFCTPLEMVENTGNRLVLGRKKQRFEVVVSGVSGEWKMRKCSDFEREYDTANPGKSMVWFEFAVPESGLVSCDVRMVEIKKKKV